MSNELSAKGQRALQKGRYQLQISHPYYMSALYSLVPVFTEEVPTLAVDQYLRLYINPEYLEGRSPKFIAATLAHEINHVLRQHSTRCGARDRQGWNIAGDAEINDDLRSDGALECHDKWVYPETIECSPGLTAEEYYARSGGQKKPGGVGTGSGDCGSVADGVPRTWEQGEPGLPGTSPGVAPGEVDVIRQQVAEAIASAPGKLPGGLERWAKQWVKPVVPWRQVLRGAVRNAVRMAQGSTDYTYQRVNRRSATLGVVLPALVKYTPNVALVLDTSGSMREDDLAHAIAEVSGVLRAVGTSVTVLATDSSAAPAQRVSRARDIKLLGGGGTNMSVGIAAAERLSPKPDLVIVVTDCETPWPRVAPSVPVIVCATRRDRGSTPVWAKVVTVE